MKLNNFNNVSEVEGWYVEPEPYLGWIVSLIMVGIVFLAGQFLMSEYGVLEDLNQEHQRLIQPELSNVLPQKSSNNLRLNTIFTSEASSPNPSLFLLKTDQASDFLQGFSTWVEKQKISIEQLSSVPVSGGLKFKLQGTGNIYQLIDFINKFYGIPLLINNITLKIIWPELSMSSSLETLPSGLTRRSPQALSQTSRQTPRQKPGLLHFELSALIHQAEPLQSHSSQPDEALKTASQLWSFVPYNWGNPLSFPHSCSDFYQNSSKYQGWLSVLSAKHLKNWVYRENACTHEWMRLN